MRKRRQIKAINGELQLPEPILHRVRSFLTAREAAQTAILSKSWHRAWLTRPNLVLDLDDVERDDESKFDEFSELAKKTIQRYEQSNLKIESLWLCIDNPRLDFDCGDLANDLITRALKIGATDLSVQFNRFKLTVVLPQVVFEAENLVQLSVEGCEIYDLDFGRKVRCSKLEFLSLWYVKINSEMICNIASYCPLIGKLSLCNVSSLNDDGHICYSFLGDLSSRFPSLKDLSLIGCKTQEVSSHSLERLNFSTGHFGPRLSDCVKFDVPSIRKFWFEGDDIPSLSFLSAPREWESNVIIRGCDGSLSTLWFRRLNKLLTESNLSRISLSLKSFTYRKCLYDVGGIRGLPKPRLENLTINDICLQALRCFALFHGLFQICRPKFITVGKLNFGGKNETNGLLWKTLARGLHTKCMYGLHDLEEVNVHLFDEDVNVWRPLPLESFLDPSMSPKVDQKTRFQFKWKT